MITANFAYRIAKDTVAKETIDSNEKTVNVKKGTLVRIIDVYEKSKTYYAEILEGENRNKYCYLGIKAFLLKDRTKIVDVFQYACILTALISLGMCFSTMLIMMGSGWIYNSADVSTIKNSFYKDPFILFILGVGLIVVSRSLDNYKRTKL